MNYDTDKQGNIINITIVNTGGTFNKFYNEIEGTLDVSNKNYFLKNILEKSKITTLPIKGLLYKDSLDITNEDREELLKVINNIPTDKILLVHGTDTMNKTAQFLDGQTKKTIVITGAMQPYSIDPVEATSNLMLGLGYLLNSKDSGIYIAMHGLVKNHTQIIKNRQKGIFECQD